MKSALVALSSALLASVAVAVPFNKRQDVEWVTAYSHVIETVVHYTTVYVDEQPATQAAAAPTDAPIAEAEVAAAAWRGGRGGQRTNDDAAAPAPAATTEAAAAPVEVVAPTPEAAAPVVPTPEPVAPVATTPAVEVPTPEPVAPAAPAAAAAAAAPAPASGSGSVYTGDITYYDVGMGSCGWTNTNDEPVVALAHGMMANGINPNANPWCGRSLTISYGGATHQAKLVDTCGGCEGASIDLSPSLFKLVAPNGDGRVHGVQWWFN